ncbi:MAG: lysylphosphatidylglycerol synthase transmembrane domain-containing protein [Verrucomicrobia bacterium]|nr:lysylphosphatidylglycerol synthase transmembrane domain-containing protein [Verrucomicrobiota bacterium]
MTSYRRLTHCLRILCALGLMIWVVKQLHLEEWQAFPWTKLDLRWLALAFLMGGLSILGWAARWWWFLRVYEIKVGFGELLRLTFFADFFNLYFLGPLGADGVRLLHLSQRFPHQRGAILGSLILDHVGGLLGGVVLYYSFAKNGAVPENVVLVVDRVLPWLVILTILGLGVIMEPPIQRMICRMRGLSQLSSWISPMYAGTFRHPWLFSGFAVSVLSTACAYSAYWSAARCVGVRLDLSFFLGVMPAVDFAASVPVSVSGLGIREGLLMQLLPLENVDSLALSLLGFAAIGVWGLAGGLWLLVWRRKCQMVTPP